MSKRRQQERMHYCVRQYDEPGTWYLARDAREAVRAWCEMQPREYWRFARDMVVEVRAEGADLVDGWRRWRVDPTQPPAWLIEPCRETDEERAG